MKIFGDDGFRDKYGTRLMSHSFLENFFHGLDLFLEEKKIKKIYIGFDTRDTHKKIIAIILENLVSLKKIYIFKVPVTTPYNHFMSYKK